MERAEQRSAVSTTTARWTAPVPHGRRRAFLSDPPTDPRARARANVAGAILQASLALMGLLTGRWGMAAMFGAYAVIHVVGVVVWRRRARAAIEDVSEIFR